MQSMSDLTIPWHEKDCIINFFRRRVTSYSSGFLIDKVERHLPNSLLGHVS